MNMYEKDARLLHAISENVIHFNKEKELNLKYGTKCNILTLYP